jgi:hypothetical protein
MSQREKYGERWEREELILAMYLYCQIPFQQTKSKNPDVVELAHILGRTPASVARKLGNFGAFDPAMAKRGIKGLTHGSKSDEKVWREVSRNWAGLIDEANSILSGYSGAQRISESPQDDSLDAVPALPKTPSGPSEGFRSVPVRLHQAFFRRTVLASFRCKCCMCGVDLPELLIASHIVPWSAEETTRTDPRNGLSLCSILDRALDSGLISLDDDFSVLASSRILRSSSEGVRDLVTRYCGKSISLPDRFVPCLDYIVWHRANVFHA